MVTPITARRFARAAAALAIAGPAALFGGVAWADDPTPAPDDTAVEAPVVQPSIGSWIIGGTLLEGNAGTPAKPVTKPVTKPAVTSVAPARTTTRTTRRTTTLRRTSTATGGATVLPFTGNRADTLLPTGIALVAGGVGLLLIGRPRRAVG